MWSQRLPYEGELNGRLVADGELDAPMGLTHAREDGTTGGSLAVVGQGGGAGRSARR